MFHFSLVDNVFDAFDADTPCFPDPFGRVGLDQAQFRRRALLLLVVLLVLGPVRSVRLQRQVPPVVTPCVAKFTFGQTFATTPPQAVMAKAPHTVGFFAVKRARLWAGQLVHAWVVLATAGMVLVFAKSVVAMPALQPPHLMPFHHGDWHLFPHRPSTKGRV